MNKLILILFLTLISFCVNGQLRFAYYRIKAEKQAIKYDKLLSQPLIIRHETLQIRTEIIINLDLNINEECKVFGCQIINTSQNPLKILTHDGSLIIIKEALDTTNKWRPIEYFFWSDCGNSYESINLQPNESIEFESYVSPGKFKTKARLKFYTGEYIHYSDSFDILINKEDFKPMQKDFFDGYSNQIESRSFLKFDEWKSNNE
jgi:hypothetical protein